MKLCISCRKAAVAHIRAYAWDSMETSRSIVMDYTSKMLQVRSTALSCDLTRTPLAGRRPGRRGPPEDPRAPAPGQGCVRRWPVLPDHRGRLASSRCSYSRFGERLVHGAAVLNLPCTFRLARFQGIPRWKGAPRADCVPIAGRSLTAGILEHTKNNLTDRSRHTGAPGGRPRDRAARRRPGSGRRPAARAGPRRAASRRAASTASSPRHAPAPRREAAAPVVRVLGTRN